MGVELDSRGRATEGRPQLLIELGQMTDIGTRLDAHLIEATEPGLLFVREPALQPASDTVSQPAGLLKTAICSISAAPDASPLAIHRPIIISNRSADRLRFEKSAVDTIWETLSYCTARETLGKWEVTKINRFTVDKQELIIVDRFTGSGCILKVPVKLRAQTRCCQIFLVTGVRSPSVRVWARKAFAGFKKLVVSDYLYFRNRMSVSINRLRPVRPGDRSASSIARRNGCQY